MTLPTEMNFVRRSWILYWKKITFVDRNDFCLHKWIVSWQIEFCVDKKHFYGHTKSNFVYEITYVSLGQLVPRIKRQIITYLSRAKILVVGLD